MRMLLLAAAAAAGAASPAAAQPAKSPKLILAISVDQFSADLFEAYRPHFTGGLKRLVDGGVTFANGYQSHASTETCPGHSTVLTGRHPADTRIIANDWIDQSTARADKKVYCAEDERVAGSTSSAYTVSPWHLAAATLGDRLKAVSPQSRNVAVAGKDRAAVMMGGRAVDQRWYWDGKTWSTDLKSAAVPQMVPLVRRYTERLIADGDGPLDPPALCQGKAKRYDLAPGLSVGDGRFPLAAGDARGFRISPRLDGMTMALALGLVTEMQLGKGPATDILSLGLSATDMVGHAYGRGGQEMCLQMLSLDRDLGGFLGQLDKAGIDYAVVLTADHGGLDMVERLRDGGNAQAQRANPALSAGTIGKQLAPQVGASGSLLLGDIGGDVWFDRSLTPQQRARALPLVLARYRSDPQVETVFTADELRRTAMPSGDPSKWTLRQRVRASFDPQRSGDLYVVLKQFVTPGTKPSAGYVAGHGSVWDYDRRVPIIFTRPGQRPAAPATAADTVDILPTLASWIGLKLDPGSVDGVCRREAAACR